MNKQKPSNIRWHMAIIIFIIAMIAYLDRMNLSISAPMIMKEYNIDKIQFGMLMTVFSIAYALIQVPGGIMAVKLGPKKVVSGAMLCWSIFTILTALAPTYAILLIIRTIFGLGEGPLWPACGHFFSKWYGKFEKGKATSSILAGSFFGAVIGPSLTVAIINMYSWHWSFFIYGFCGLIMFFIWYFYAKDLPEQHPNVNHAELLIINNNNISENISQKSSIPWKKYFSQIQFWAIGIQFFVSMSLLTFFLAWLPVYLLEARGFSLETMGMVATLPWLALTIVVLASGKISDSLIKNGIKKVYARSGLAIIGLIIAGLGLYLASIVESSTLIIIFLTISLGAVGLIENMAWASSTDLGGTNSGVISGWMNLWGNLGGAAAPLIAALLVVNFNWNISLLIMASTSIIGIIAWFFVNPDKALPLSEK